MVEYISLREFARRRGVRLSAVQKAIDSGRVTAVRRNPDGRLTGINFDQATRQWDTGTDPVQAARSGQVIGGAMNNPGPKGPSPLGEPAGMLWGNTPFPAQETGGVPAAPFAGISASADGAPSGALDSGEEKDDSSYLEARAKRERFAAATAELEYLKAIGELVPAGELRESAVRRYRAIRDKLLNIPDRLAAVLAAETDSARVHTALTAELKRVLHELSDDAGSDAARGIAERLAA